MLTVVSDNSNYLKVLNAKSRSIEVFGNELTDVHRKIGLVLGQKYLDTLMLKETKIINPQGSEGVDLTLDCSNVTIVCLLRAGLYIAEGVRQSLGNSDHSYVLSNNPDDVSPSLVSGRDVVIVDSVVNTGRTLMNYIDRFELASSVSVISLVMQDAFRTIVDEKYPNNNFIVSRVSKNSYVGQGANDTGNRLFGTFVF